MKEINEINAVEMISELQREIRYREYVYGKKVACGAMPEWEMIFRINIIKAIIELIKAETEKERFPLLG